MVTKFIYIYIYIKLLYVFTNSEREKEERWTRVAYRNILFCHTHIYIKGMEYREKFRSINCGGRFTGRVLNFGHRLLGAYAVRRRWSSRFQVVHSMPLVETRAIALDSLLIVTDPVVRQPT